MVWKLECAGELFKEMQLERGPGWPPIYVYVLGSYYINVMLGHAWRIMPRGSRTCIALFYPHLWYAGDGISCYANDSSCLVQSTPQGQFAHIKHTFIFFF